MIPMTRTIRYREYQKQYKREHPPDKERIKAYREANRVRNRTSMRSRVLKHKEQAVEFLGGKCSRCGGVFDSCVYDFHHRNPEEKEKELSSIMNKKWDNIVLELQKCDLLCANCHRLEHKYNDLEEDFAEDEDDE